MKPTEQPIMLDDPRHYDWPMQDAPARRESGAVAMVVASALVTIGAVIGLIVGIIIGAGR